MKDNAVRIDYFTGTIKPGTSGATIEQVLSELLDVFKIKDIYDNFEYVSSCYSYEMILRYANIQIKIPYLEQFERVGLCIEMSGSGLDYYQNFLSTLKCDIRTCFCNFVAMSERGYKTSCSRLDIACDDICYGDDRQLLDLDIIEQTLMSRAFVSKFRRSDPLQCSGELVSVFNFADIAAADDKMPFRRVSSLNISSGELGRTIYLGRSQSNTSVRIYDKKAEQLVRGEKLREDLTSWVRFEIQLRHKNASAMFLCFCKSDSDQDFTLSVSRLAFDLIRFVDLDHSRLYNCTVCDWWLAFLGSIADKGLYINRLSSNQYLRSKKYASLYLAALLAALDDCDDNFISDLIKIGKQKDSKTKSRIKSDYKSFMSLSPGDRDLEISKVYHVLSGVEYWDQFVDHSVAEDIV